MSEKKTDIANKLLFKIVELLLGHGADVSLVNVIGENALEIAIAAGKRSAYLKLLYISFCIIAYFVSLNTFTELNSRC